MTARRARIVAAAVAFSPALLAALVVLTLTACDATTPDEPEPSDVGGDLYVQTVDLPDGREVDCVIYASYNQGGLSCDWDRAR